MSYTKRQAVQAALTELGIADYSFDVMPEQLEQGLRRLDAMVAEWNGRGIRVSYALPASPETSDLDQDSGIPDSCWEAVITNLALRLAPAYGKAVNMATMVVARQSLNTVLARAAMPSEMQLPSMPSGAGNKSPDVPFTPIPTTPLVTGTDNELAFN